MQGNNRVEQIPAAAAQPGPSNSKDPKGSKFQGLAKVSKKLAAKTKGAVQGLISPPPVPAGDDPNNPNRLEDTLKGMGFM